MKPNPLLRQIFNVTLLILLSTSFFFASYGASEDDNTQLSIETIIDQALNVGDETTVEVTITDTARGTSSRPVSLPAKISMEVGLLRTFPSNRLKPSTSIM